MVVCDATCLERNLNLVLQIMECTDQVLVCVNFMDEAAKKTSISIWTSYLTCFVYLLSALTQEKEAHLSLFFPGLMILQKVLLSHIIRLPTAGN